MPKQLKPRKHVYRRDDRVVVVNPLVVRRVGYPLGIADGLKHVESYASDVAALLGKLGIRDLTSAYQCSLLEAGLQPTLPTDGGVNRALAYAWLCSQRFGGPERSIHTELMEPLRDAECRVYGKRVVYTGRRDPGTTTYCYDGIPDHEPPYLGRAKAHVLLELEAIDWDLRRITEHHTFELEETNVAPAPIQPCPWADTLSATTLS